MDMADEAVPFHELLVGGRSVSGVRPDAARRVGLVEKSIAQTAALIGGGVRRAPFANEAETAIERDVVLIAEHRNRQIDRRRRSILARLARAAWPWCIWVYLTVQRASRSFWRSFAGLSFQSSGMRPPLIAFFASWVLRRRGAAIRRASTIWAAMAMEPNCRSIAEALHRSARTMARWRRPW